MPMALRVLTRDGWLLFLTRGTRLFAYGALSVVLVFYLTGLGLTTSQTGLLLALTLAGDTVVSLYLTTQADRIGRRRMLIVGAILMALAGLAFASTSNLVFLIIAGTIGVISPSGNEVGPFLPIEQAALSHVVPPDVRTAVFAWYTLAGSFATATGSLCAGMLSHLLQRTAMPPVGSYRVVVLLYAALGVPLHASVARRGNERARSRVRPFRGHGEALRDRSLARRGAQVVGPVRPGLLCRWLRGAEFRRLLVLSAVWREPANARRDLLLGQSLCGDLGVAGVATGGSLRPRQHDGVHAPAVEHLAPVGTVDADPAARHPRAASALQHQPNGRADAAVLSHGGRWPRGTIGGGGHNGRGANDRCGDRSPVRGILVRKARTDQPALLHRRDPESPLRPPTVPRICRSSATGGGRGAADRVSPEGTMHTHVSSGRKGSCRLFGDCPAYKNLYISPWRRSACFGSGLRLRTSEPFRRRRGGRQATSWISYSTVLSRVTGSPWRPWVGGCMRSESMPGLSTGSSISRSMRRVYTCSTPSRSGRARLARPTFT